MKFKPGQVIEFTKDIVVEIIKVDRWNYTFRHLGLNEFNINRKTNLDSVNYLAIYNNLELYKATNL